MGRPAVPFTDPGDSPGWDKFLPRRVMSGTGLRIGSTHFVGLERQGEKIRSEADPRVGGLDACTVQLDDTNGAWTHRQTLFRGEPPRNGQYCDPYSRYMDRKRSGGTSLLTLLCSLSQQEERRLWTPGSAKKIITDEDDWII
jgi:hypothetical protein